ncbi:MAG: hypothetical protein KAV87_19470 [Desulfobacteraceae bacterium]|nr:hypothetical protein [Desulfobacteraceae bacterium]
MRTDESYWFYSPVRCAFVHVRPGAEIPDGDNVNLDDPDIVDCTIRLRHAKQLLDFMTREYPEMVTIYRGRDKEDIKIVHRLLDIVEKKER